VSCQYFKWPWYNILVDSGVKTAKQMLGEIASRNLHVVAAPVQWVKYVSTVWEFCEGLMPEIMCFEGDNTFKYTVENDVIYLNVNTENWRQAIVHCCVESMEGDEVGELVKATSIIVNILGDYNEND